MYSSTSMHSGDGLGIFPLIIAAASAVAPYVVKAFKGKPKVEYEVAKNAIRQIYLEILERDPWDPNNYDKGAEGYIPWIVDGTKPVDEIRTEILSSQEYKDLQLRKARAVYGSSQTSAAFLPGVVPPELEGILPYALGGVLLLFLLRR